MRKRILTSIIALSLLSASPVHAYPTDTHSHRYYHGIMSDYFYDTLAQCETGHNWQHSTRTYTSAFGINRDVWKRWSNSSSAKGKDPIYQVSIVDNIAFLGHTKNGKFSAPVGLWGWGCIKHSLKLQAIICKSKDPKVYRQRRH
jgi:hypothetical protein